MKPTKRTACPLGIGTELAPAQVRHERERGFVLWTDTANNGRVTGADDGSRHPVHEERAVVQAAELGGYDEVTDLAEASVRKAPL